MMRRGAQSTDTREMYFSAKRQQYLIDQGYTFKVNQYLVEESDKHSVLLKTKKQELDLLSMIVEDQLDLTVDEAEEDKNISKHLVGEYGGRGGASAGGGTASTATRRVSNISSLSGAGGYTYSEASRKR